MLYRLRKSWLLPLLVVFVLTASPFARAFCKVVTGAAAHAATVAVATMPSHPEAGRTPHVAENGTAPATVHTMGHASGHASDHAKGHATDNAGVPQDGPSQHEHPPSHDCPVCLALAAAKSVEVLSARDSDRRYALRVEAVEHHLQVQRIALRLGGLGSRAPPVAA